MPRDRPATSSLPVWGALAAAASMFIGWNWDICWHRCIGRDTTWTPPHIAIYIALAIAFVYNAWMVLSYTFGRRREWPAVRVMGFRAPGGCFITLWAILAQFASIVFDDWWHRAYGLDSQVFTPPHFVLGAAIGGFYIGQIILVSTYGNTVLKDRPTLVRWIITLMWALALGNSLVGADALYGPYVIRSAAFVISASSICCFSLIALRQYLQWRWAMVAHAAAYMLIVIALMQIFQLFPAEPRFAPVYHRVDTFAPPPFPLLLVVPALVLGEVLHALAGRRRLVRFGVGAVAFVVVFIAVNWLSSWFLTTEWSHNRFFAGDYPAAAFAEGYAEIRDIIVFGPRGAVEVLIAMVSAFLGLWTGRVFGGWLRAAVR